MADWKCTMKTDKEDVLFITPDEDFKAILATIAECKSKKVKKDILL